MWAGRQGELSGEGSRSRAEVRGGAGAAIRWALAWVAWVAFGDAVGGREVDADEAAGSRGEGGAGQAVGPGESCDVL